jgi:hypothetical protein
MMRLPPAAWDCGAVAGVLVLVYGLYCIHWKAGVIAAGILIVLMCILGARAHADTDETTRG